MGAKSTYDISRDLAIQVVQSKIERCSNKELSEMLEALKESEYGNYKVVDSLSSLSDETWVDCRIISVGEFFND